MTQWTDRRLGNGAPPVLDTWRRGLTFVLEMDGAGIIAQSPVLWRCSRQMRMRLANNVQRTTAVMNFMGSGMALIGCEEVQPMFWGG